MAHTASPLLPRVFSLSFHFQAATDGVGLCPPPGRRTHEMSIACHMGGQAPAPTLPVWTAAPAAPAQMLVERVAHECHIPAGVKPLEQLACAEYVLGMLWAHDRLRDAWAWRALLVRGAGLCHGCSGRMGSSLHGRGQTRGQ